MRPLTWRLWPAFFVGLTSAVPGFVVDLDEAPEERWKHVIQYYRQLGVLEVFGRWDPDQPHADAALEKEWLDIARARIADFDDMSREIDGWVKYAGDLNITRDTILLGVVQYEMNYPVYCSGLVAAMLDGTMVHARNMDYALSVEVGGKTISWPELTVDVTFVRAGKPLMTAVYWPCQVGIHTGMRFDGWSFEQNTRRLGDDMQKNLHDAKQGGVPFSLHVRHTMQTVPDFSTAVKKLWNVNLMAPMYFVMTGAGKFEATVLTMDGGGKHLSGSPPPSRLDEAGDTWFLLQTNDDTNGMPQDPRRPLMKMQLSRARQQDVSPEWAFKQMRDSPLKQEETVFTWIAVPSSGYHRTILPWETLDEGDPLSSQRTASGGVSLPSDIPSGSLVELRRQKKLGRGAAASVLAPNAAWEA